jgi:toxin ParE1/3/4
MAHRVAWSQAALRDIEAIANYIEQDSPAYARIVVCKLVAAGRQLEAFPFSGRPVPELGEPGVRELIVYSYRLIYRVTADTVMFIAVVHSRQDLSQAPLR